MEVLNNLWSHWSSSSLQDLITGIFILIVIFVTIFIHQLFESFINSKPSGRKTVIGKGRISNTNIMGVDFKKLSIQIYILEANKYN